MRLFLIVCLLLTTGCLSKKSTTKQATQNIFAFETLKQLLGEELKSVKLMYASPAIVTDTTFESEDGESWPGLVFYSKNQKIFFAESSWQKKQNICRVIIVNNLIKSSSGIMVSNKFKEIRDRLSETIPSYPDGYFGLRDRTDPGITYFFDTDSALGMRFGNISFDQIPEDLVVAQIVIESIP